MAYSTIATPLNIAELACEYLGEGTDDLADIETPGSSVTEEIINRHYVPTRQAILRKHRWNFAIERVELVEDGTAPNFGPTSRFAIPSDNLRILEINGILAGTSENAWYLEQGYILLSTNVAKCVYVKDVTDVTTYDPLFIEAFALKLAINCCVALTQSFEKKRILQAEYAALALPDAMGVDAREDRPKIIERRRDSRTLAARKHGVYVDLVPAIDSEQWLEITGTIADGSNTATVSFVDAGGGSVTMPIAPTLDEIILTYQFAEGGSVTTVAIGTITTSSVDIDLGATNHGGLSYGLRIKRNT